MQQAKSANRLAFGQNAQPFFANAFPAHLVNFAGHRTYGLPGFVFDLISEPGAETHGPHNSELVFFKTRVGIADRANQLCSNVRLSVHVIDNFVCQRIEQQSVDGEIPAKHILLCIRKDNAGRPPPVDIGLIGAERRNLKWMASMNHENDSKLNAYTYGPRKDLHYFFRTRARGDVVIGRLKSHHHVAYTSSNEIGFKAVYAQLTNDLDGRGGVHAGMIALRKGGATPQLQK